MYGSQSGQILLPATKFCKIMGIGLNMRGINGIILFFGRGGGWGILSTEEIKKIKKYPPI